MMMKFQDDSVPGKGSRRNMSIILTGAVIQSYRGVLNTGLNDPRERLCDYLCAIPLWLERPELDHVVYCDASGVRIPEELFENDKFESLSIDLRLLTLEKGKGPSESRSLEYVMETSPYLSENFYKCTGRLFVRNFEEIHSGIDHSSELCTLSKREWTGEADTRFYWLNRNYYRDRIQPYLGENDDYVFVNIEHVYYRYCLHWNPMPDLSFVGRFGHDGTFYEEGFSRESKERAKSLMERCNIFQRIPTPHRRK